MTTMNRKCVVHAFEKQKQATEIYFICFFSAKVINC